jgi:hypothetical protein
MLAPKKNFEVLLDENKSARVNVNNVPFGTKYAF